MGGPARRSRLSGQGGAGTSRERAFPWFPTWMFPWEDDSTSPPKAYPRSPWRPKGQDWVPPSHGQQREARRGRPASCSRLHPENLRASFLRGSGPGQDGRWERRGRAGAGGQGRRPQTSAGSPGLGGTDSSMSVLHTHTPGGEPGPSCGDRESWRPLPVPGDRAAEGPGPPDLRCPCPPFHLLLGPRLPQGGTPSP